MTTILRYTRTSSSRLSTVSQHPAPGGFVSQVQKEQVSRSVSRDSPLFSAAVVLNHAPSLNQRLPRTPSKSNYEPGRTRSGVIIPRKSLEVFKIRDGGFQVQWRADPSEDFFDRLMRVCHFSWSFLPCRLVGAKLVVSLCQDANRDPILGGSQVSASPQLRPQLGPHNGALKLILDIQT
jgi:hypothetical protein